MVSGLACGSGTRAPLWPILPSTDTIVVSVVLRVIVLRYPQLEIPGQPIGLPTCEGPTEGALAARPSYWHNARIGDFDPNLMVGTTKDAGTYLPPRSLPAPVLGSWSLLLLVACVINPSKAASSLTGPTRIQHCRRSLRLGH